MKGLAGHKTEQKQLDEYMMRLLHQFTCTVFMVEVDGLIAYSSGSQTVIEARITVPSTITISGSHTICQTIQNHFE